jgi:hypothetical protein
MRAASTLTAIGSALLFAVTSAHGLGFGRVVNADQLGQPLNFAAALRLDADESLERECVSAEVQSGTTSSRRLRSAPRSKAWEPNAMCA